MSNELTILESRKKELHTILEGNKGLISSFSLKEKKDFSANFIELANNEYLMKVIIDKKLILRLAISLAKQGLDVHPSKRQCYIVPFDTKVNGQKIMLPQEIIPTKGHQQKALNHGFMLTPYQVWSIDGNVVSEKNMSYEEKVQVDDTDEQFRNDFFFGWDIELVDLLGTLPVQAKFVSFKYAKTASKNMSTPKEFLLQGLVHKAIRRAERDFSIPNDRDFEFTVDHTNPIDVAVVQSDPMEDIEVEVAKPTDTPVTEIDFNKL